MQRFMIDQFLDYLRYEKRRSKLTVERYEDSLRDFQCYFERLENGVDWTSVDADVIRGWMEDLMDRGNIASTVNTDLSALKSFSGRGKVLLTTIQLLGLSITASITRLSKTRSPCIRMMSSSFNCSLAQ